MCLLILTHSSQFEHNWKGKHEKSHFFHKSFWWINNIRSLSFQSKNWFKWWVWYICLLLGKMLNIIIWTKTFIHNRLFELTKYHNLIHLNYYATLSFVPTCPNKYKYSGNPGSIMWLKTVFAYMYTSTHTADFWRDLGDILLVTNTLYLTKQHV